MNGATHCSPSSSHTVFTGDQHGKLPSQGHLPGNAVLQAIMQSPKSKNLKTSSIPGLASEHPKMPSSTAVPPEQKNNHQLSHLLTDEKYWQQRQIEEKWLRTLFF